MKHQLDDRLREGMRREVREAPAGLAGRVQAQLGERETVRPRVSRWRPYALPAGLAAAALLCFALWPRPEQVEPSAVRATLLSMDIPQRGIEFAARLDRPLAEEWQRTLADSRALYAALLGQLPTLPR
ncbi:MAG: hypothetical protein IPJ19_11095 [Planctomycetes bacterium]|nr:hypothetical protein [Planctomycetota bacterium]